LFTSGGYYAEISVRKKMHLAVRIPKVEGEPLPTVLRGTIDLVFREEDGWVVVDYKTDDDEGTDVDALVAEYEGQVNTYAAYWQDLTGQKVKEKALYLVNTGKYVSL
jgi:ATP-dependent helicase/nuclease subunit A